VEHTRFVGSFRDSQIASQVSLSVAALNCLDWAMHFRWRWFLILCALVLGSGPAMAATAEERAYAAGVQAFHDELYSVATNKLTQFLQTYRRSTNAPMAVLLLAQSEYFQKNYAAAVGRLADPANLARGRAAGLADGYYYWRAEAEFAQGDRERAAQTFTSLADEFPRSPLAMKSLVEAAKSFGQNGDWPRLDALLDNPDGLFQRRAQEDPGDEQVIEGRLLQAESKCRQRNFAGAVAALELLSPAALTPEQGWNRAYWLYRANLGLNDLDAALTATTSLLEIAGSGQGEVWATNLAESVISRATVLERQNLLTNAIAFLQENLVSNNVPAAQKEQILLNLADLAVEQSNRTDAVARLEMFLTNFPASPAAEIAQLTLGELNFVVQPSNSNDLAAAEVRLDTLTNGPLAGKAFLALGWGDWLQQKYPESLANFSAAASVLPFGRDLAVAKFKMGDALFALTNFPGARINYRSVLTDFSSLPQVTNWLAGRALYQILRTDLALTNAAGAYDDVRQMLDAFSASGPTQHGLLLAGEGFSDFNEPANARTVLLKFETEFTNSPLLPEVAFAIARTDERQQDWPDAIAREEAWLKTYSATNALRANVEFARDWAVSQTDEDRAFQLFTNFVVQYPANANTPLALWWVADRYFRLGDTIEAEKYYQKIFQDFPANPLTYRAKLMAGRAALARSQPTEANSYVVPLIQDTNCPEPLQDQARFAYCESLRLMGASETNNYSLQLATNVLGEMTPKAMTNIVGALAWNEMGDCNLAMGALDAATNAYLLALSSPAASPQLRTQARVGLGQVLETKAEGSPARAQRMLRLLALQNYADVIYSTNEVADPFWVKEAAVRALRLMPLVDEGNVNKFIDRLELWLPQLRDTLEKKRIVKN
jgi:TolA-binding protein